MARNTVLRGYFAHFGAFFLARLAGVTGETAEVIKVEAVHHIGVRVVAGSASNPVG